MTDRTPYRPVDTRIWDGTRDTGLATWLGDHFAHWDGDRLVVRTTDGETRPQPGWTLRLMPDGQLMVSSPHAARRLNHLYDRLDTAETALDHVRDAAALHRQGLLSTAELYAVIEASPTPGQPKEPTP